MFANLAVIIEQGTYGALRQYLRKTNCDNDPENLYTGHDCPNHRGIDACFQILLLFSALSLVVCLAALLAMHAKWILDLVNMYILKTVLYTMQPAQGGGCAKVCVK